MRLHFGEANVQLTAAIRRIASRNTAAVIFSTHSQEEMDDDGFDHLDVLGGLRKGVAYGPEIRDGQFRANVVHRGFHIRVVIGGLDGVNQDWARLQRLRVVSVMRVN